MQKIDRCMKFNCFYSQSVTKRPNISPTTCRFDSFDQCVRENATFVAVLCSKAQKTNHFLHRPIFNIVSFYRHSVFFGSNFVLRSSEETEENMKLVVKKSHGIQLQI